MVPVADRGDNIPIFNFSNILFDQKSAALTVPVANRGDQHTIEKTDRRTTYRLNLHRGQFRKEEKRAIPGRPKLFL